MQIEINVEKLVSRSIIDGILKSENVREEVDNVLESEEYKKKLEESIKNRIDGILSSEDGRRQIDSVIMETIKNSDDVTDFIEDILKGDEYKKILQQEIMACLQKVILSEEGKTQILDKIKEYIDEYEIEYNDNFDSEMKDLISDMLLTTMKDSFKRFKESNVS